MRTRKELAQISIGIGFLFLLGITAVYLYIISINETALSATNSGEVQSKLVEKALPLNSNICFDTSSITLRSTPAENGCDLQELDLGSQAISAPDMPSKELNPILNNRFLAAKTVAKSAGVNLDLTSGYRSIELQEKLFADAVQKYGSEAEASKWVLPSQYSHHPMGLAIDVNLPNGKIGAKWLETNGAEFGLCRVYENEWWHFEGVIAPGQICPARKMNATEDIK